MKKGFPKVLIFNAPPKSGKDTCADYCSEFMLSEHKMFKEPLLKMCAKILKMEFSDFMQMYEKNKDNADTIHISNFLSFSDSDKHPQLCNYSLREFIIHISENVMKPIFGDTVFGLEAGKNLSKDKWNIFSDGGFKEEIIGLCNYVPSQNIIVVKIQRDRCSFKEGLIVDSRGWIDDKLVGHTLYIDNNGTIEQLYLRLDEIIDNLSIGT